jgi:hypothetical protein
MTYGGVEGQLPSFLVSVIGGGERLSCPSGSTPPPPKSPELVLKIAKMTFEHSLIVSNIVGEDL